MNLSAVFIDRPVATTLLSVGVAIAGVLSFALLPVAPLPQVEYPAISVQASMPGASPETMAATVATPLERALGSIAGVNEMTSTSSQGSTRISLQFDLERDINGAARDVQAAINLAQPLLPSGMPSRPSYRKVNPAESPMLIIALTSTQFSRADMVDVASTVLVQRLSQVDGVGQVTIGGGALPAVRVAVQPDRLSAYGLSLEQVRQTLVAGNAHRPKGMLEDAQQAWQIEANDQAYTPADFAGLVIRYQNNRAVRVQDVAQVSEAMQDVRTDGISQGKPAVLLVLYQQPGANVIQAVDAVRRLLPSLQKDVPSGMAMEVVSDRTPTIRGSLAEIQKSLAMSMGLVILVVALFLRRWRTALIPAVAVPLSLAGTCAVMYLFNFSLNNLSLMALTIATGFVVDDAIVVLEHITRLRERGMPLHQAVRQGSRDIGFTVVAISVSLVAVFIPILFMGGVLGRLFHEFAVVMTAAVLMSLLVSLTTTPMMCAKWLPAEPMAVTPRRRQPMVRWYRRSLAWTLRHQWLMWLVLLATVLLNVSLYRAIPKGFFPQQDTGRINGYIRADQSSSFQAMQQRLHSMLAIVQADPAVLNVTGFTGNSQRNAAQMFMTLKPRNERDASADEVVKRLRAKLSKEPGARLFMTPVQDLRIGARAGGSQFEYTIKADELAQLREWEPKIRRALAKLKELEDINNDYEDRGLQTSIVIDRDALARLGLTMRDVDATLANAYSQRQVSTIYNPLNQYRVVLELGSSYLQNPSSLDQLNVINSRGQAVPLRSFAQVVMTGAALSVSHDAGVPSDTFSFSLAPGVSLSQATEAIHDTVAQLHLPVSVRGGFAGTANAFEKSLKTQPLLLLAALLTLYLVLGVLYESLLHPLTILSSLPSAGVGALLTLTWFDMEFSVIAMIGVILLIGIVKKNAILMIDVALQTQRRGRSAAQSIFMAAQSRLRPILMTTVAAMLGAIPLAWAYGVGAEMRQPLGLSVLGGLLLSQLLTLYTTPIVFVGLEHAKAWTGGLFGRGARRHNPSTMNGTVA
ncbi:MAG: multidrug transporter subunit MdtC [Betaproteobacteria bacterium]|nr:multidrug transporter subunit MdtC [Betaproteobacteria bacterium]